MSLERQVRVAAGALAGGGALAVAVSPWFGLVPAFVGAGLVYAGITDRCGMAMLLGKLPYNRRGTAEPARAPHPPEAGRVPHQWPRHPPAARLRSHPRRDDAARRPPRRPDRGGPGARGGGGSILTVRALVRAGGFAPRDAIVGSLIVVGVAATAGAFLHWRRETLDLVVAGWFSGLGAVAAIAGGRLGRLVSGEWLMVAFGVVAVTAGVMLLSQRASPAPPLPGRIPRSLGPRRSVSAS